jgi:SAM-dependent methyltransferase
MAASYLTMVGDVRRGFNHLAADVAIDMLGNCDRLVVLDVGAGEGSVARRLADLGAHVVAVEPTHDLLNAAVNIERDAPRGINYHGDHVEDLRSLASESVDAALAVLVLHHVGDLDISLTELRRVLRPRGRLVLVIPHPWSDHPGAAWQPVEQGSRRVVGDYSIERFWSTDEEASVRSVGWHHRTVASWLNALSQARFNIVEVREPIGNEPRRPDGGGPWAGVPRFFAVSAQRS